MDDEGDRAGEADRETHHARVLLEFEYIGVAGYAETLRLEAKSSTSKDSDMSMCSGCRIFHGRETAALPCGAVAVCSDARFEGRPGERSAEHHHG